MSVDRGTQFWETFGRFQCGAADRRRLTGDWSAPDEALSAVLDSIDLDDLPTSTELDFILHRLTENRCRKFVRREKLLRCNASLFQKHVVSPEEIASQKDQNAWVHAKVTPVEWQCLRRLAAGECYEDIATSIGTNTATLKCRISRCRQRLRNQAG